jgi:di/tricarboxylate transporter
VPIVAGERRFGEIDFGRIRLLADLDRVSVAELIPSFEEVHVGSGEILYRTGDEGDAFFIIIDGIVRVFVQPGGKELEIACLGPGEWFGEMALLTGEPRSTDMEAQTDLVLLKLSRKDFHRLIRKYPSLGVSLAGLLAAKLVSTNAVMRGIRQQPPLPSAGAGGTIHPETSGPTAKRAYFPSLEGFRRFGQGRSLGVLIAVAAAGCATALLANAGIGAGRIVLVDLLLAATVLWSLQTFSFLTVSIALPVAAVVSGAATPTAAFSGFSSSTWFLVLGVLGMSAAISKTGLLYRLTLLMMKRFPRDYLGQTFAVALSGLLMTPVIPSPNGRLVLASPLVLTMSEILGFRKGSDGAVGLSMATLLGYGNMSVAFMNGSFICFFMIGFLPHEVAATITWGYWLKTTWLLSIFFFLLTYLSIVAFYRPREMGELVPSVTDLQLSVLGPLTKEEKISLLAVAITLGGFLTQSWHHVDGAWVTLLSLLILFATSVLDENTLRSRIDWAFLISLGALISFGNVIASSGLPEMVSRGARPYLQLLVGSSFVFLLASVAGVFLLRLFLPAFPAIVVSLLALVPLGTDMGINPFVIGVIVLLAIEPWLLPHQSLLFQTLWSATEGRLFDHRQTMKSALVHVLVCLLAVAGSIPFWKHVGLIR